MGGWRPGRTVGALAASLMLHSCTGIKPPVGPEPEQKVFDRTAESSPDPVTAGIDRQAIPPGQEPHMSRAGTALEPGEAIWIPTGKSRVLQLKNPLKRVSIGDPEVAGIVVLGPRTIMINAKEVPPRPGMEGGGGGGSRTVGMVTGHTLTPEPHFAETTLIIWDGSATPDIHTLFVADFANQQVMLEVTVAELDRTGMEEHGINFANMAAAFASAYFMGGGFTGQFTDLGTQGLGLGPANLPSPTYAFRLPKDDITVFIQLLQAEGLATVLAQPRIMAMSGQNAVFQVGGEIPIRIATGFATDVQYKPFGTIVNFVARVSDEGDIILTVTPEVSQPDFGNRVEDIPVFRTRRASTAARLRNGETLVLGGLLEHDKAENVSGIPYLQDIPYVGYIFRHTTYTSTVTEVMVVVTPRLVHPLSPATEVALPTDRGPLTNEEIRTQPNPYEVTRPRIPGVP